MTVQAPADVHAPLVVLQEIQLHGRQPTQPTIAIWADGRVLFSRTDAGRSEERETTISARAAKRIAQDVFAALDGVPRYTNVFSPYIVTGGQLTTIIARADSRWRTASVSGAYRDGLFGIQTKADSQGPPAQNPVPPNGQPIAVADPFPSRAVKHDAPPRFAGAYRRLIDSLPREGKRFTPFEFNAVFFAPKGVKMLPRDTPWPRDLPAPPVDLEPSGCDPYETDGCQFIVDPQFRDQAERFIVAVHSVDHSSTPVIANGSRYVVRFDALYEGQRDVDVVVTCGRRSWEDQAP